MDILFLKNYAYITNDRYYIVILFASFDNLNIDLPGGEYKTISNFKIQVYKFI